MARHPTRTAGPEPRRSSERPEESVPVGASDGLSLLRHDLVGASLWRAFPSEASCVRRTRESGGSLRSSEPSEAPRRELLQSIPSEAPRRPPRSSSPSAHNEWGSSLALNPKGVSGLGRPMLNSFVPDLQPFVPNPATKGTPAAGRARLAQAPRRASRRLRAQDGRSVARGSAEEAQAAEIAEAFSGRKTARLSPGLLLKQRGGPARGSGSKKLEPRRHVDEPLDEPRQTLPGPSARSSGPTRTTAGQDHLGKRTG